MEKLFGSEQKPVEAAAQEGNVAPENDGTEPVEKSFTPAEVEQIVKDRLARESKKHQKKLDELVATKKPSGNVEEDLRTKVSEYEQTNKSLAEKLKGYRANQLKSRIEKKLADYDCNDPELLTDFFLSRNLVRMDDDDSLVIENADGNLDSLIKAELQKRPHLVKPSQQTGGLGMKQPGATKIASLNPAQIKNFSPEEFAAWKKSQGITPNGGKLFG